MTTRKAAALYLAQHLAQWDNRPPAVYNPHEKPLDELPVIYGFNNGGQSDWLEGVLLAEDGTCLGSHICSSEHYMLHDLGIVEGARADRHETFREHYPSGYRMEFVPYNDALTNPGLATAIAAAKGEDDD